MNDLLAERIAVALEQLALELSVANERGTVPPRLVQPSPLTNLIGGVGPSPEYVAALTAAATAPVSPAAAIMTQTFQPIAWACPVHGSKKVVPAGISKAGNPYTAFVVCDQYGCPEKPPRGPAPQRAMPPSEGPQGPRQLP